MDIPDETKNDKPTSADNFETLISSHPSLFNSVHSVRNINYRNIINDMHNLISPQDGWTPLLPACLNGKVDIVSKLLAQGANINAQDKVSLQSYNNYCYIFIPYLIYV